MRFPHFQSLYSNVSCVCEHRVEIPPVQRRECKFGRKDGRRRRKGREVEGGGQLGPVGTLVVEAAGVRRAGVFVIVVLG
jgi:hypothetical protein